MKTIPTCKVGTVTPTTGPRHRKTEPGLLDRILRFHACLPQLDAREVGKPKPSSMPVSIEPWQVDEKDVLEFNSIKLQKKSSP